MCRLTQHDCRAVHFEPCITTKGVYLLQKVMRADGVLVTTNSDACFSTHRQGMQASTRSSSFSPRSENMILPRWSSAFHGAGCFMLGPEGACQQHTHVIRAGLL